MDLLRSLRNGNLGGGYEGGGTDSAPLMKDATFRPQTISELIDAQIGFHEKKISDLKEAKAAVSPEVERALNALAKL